MLFFPLKKEIEELEVVQDLGMWGWSRGIMAKEVGPEDHI